MKKQFNSLVSENTRKKFKIKDWYGNIWRVEDVGYAYCLHLKVKGDRKREKWNKRTRAWSSLC